MFVLKAQNYHFSYFVSSQKQFFCRLYYWNFQHRFFTPFTIYSIYTVYFVVLSSNTFPKHEIDDIEGAPKSNARLKHLATINLLFLLTFRTACKKTVNWIFDIISANNEKRASFHQSFNSKVCNNKFKSIHDDEYWMLMITKDHCSRFQFV